MDGGTSATSTTIVDGDRVVLNDNGTMVQAAVTDIDTYVSGTSKTLTNKTLTAPKIADGGFIADANGNELVVFQTTGSAVNELDIANAATGGAVTLSTTGGDSDIDLTLTPKGTGEVNIAAGDLNYAGIAVTATGAELNAAADIDTRVENVTSTNSITAAETGKTFFLNSVTEFESTLPAPAAGLEYTFIVKAAPSGASYEIKTNGDTDILIGLVTCATADDLGATDDNADVVRFVGGQAVVGDWVRVVSDGTSWYFSGACKVAEAITTATS